MNHIKYRQGWMKGVFSDSYGYTYWVDDRPRAFIRPSNRHNGKRYTGRVYSTDLPNKYFDTVEEAQIMLAALVHLEGGN